MAGKENREIKNSVFVDLFYEDESAEANEIALFNAIHDQPLPDGTKIRKFRVDNTIYMNFQNDISFDAGGKVIVFGEHQSTINENMPLRSLLYIGRAYERIVPPRSRYKKKLVPLPTPEFYTFYNGKEKWQKEQELRLSDAYIVKENEPSLELKVKVINIRPEEHHEILEKCQVLKEYSQFMDTVQSYQLSGADEPYKKAIKECIEKGILADYLRRKGGEVINMLLDEYDYETDIEVQREEAYQIGEQAGLNKGREEGRKEGRKEGTLQKICSLIQKKLEKGKTISEIADDLEDTEENISHLIEEFHLHKK
jgi:predicted transposase YdaD